MKIKERKKIDNCLDLGSELKKLWNMKVTGLPIIVGTFTKGCDRFTNSSWNDPQRFGKKKTGGTGN